MPDPLHWIVTTDGARPIEQVAGDLERTGFVVRELLPETKAIAGVASDKIAARVRRLRGVVDVAPGAPGASGAVPPATDAS
jgi:hypothetical protein